MCVVITGALIGPSVGIQSATGVIYFSMVFGEQHWLYWSKDFGATWSSSAPLTGLGECSIAFLVSPTDGRIIMNCRTGPGHRAQVWHTFHSGTMQTHINHKPNTAMALCWLTWPRFSCDYK